MAAFCVASLAVFFVAVFQLDPVVRWLWPIPVAAFVLYPYLKLIRGSHAWPVPWTVRPLGAWAAVTGEF